MNSFPLKSNPSSIKPNTVHIDTRGENITISAVPSFNQQSRPPLIRSPTLHECEAPSDTFPVPTVVKDNRFSYEIGEVDQLSYFEEMQKRLMSENLRK